MITARRINWRRRKRRWGSVEHAQEGTEGLESFESLVAQIHRGVPLGTRPDIVSRALANALLIEGQLLLERTSTDDDIALFFESFGREPSDVTTWAGTILKGLTGRELDDTTIRELCDRALNRAVTYVQQRSPLAFGSR